MRRTLLVISFLLGLGVVIALVLAARRAQQAPTEASEPAPQPSAPPAPVAQEPAPAFPQEPVAEELDETTGEIEVTPVDVGIRVPVETSETVEEDISTPEVVSAAPERDPDVNALRAELEQLPRQPLFERANAAGVPTSRTILMSREELIEAIEEIELGSGAHSSA